jgi:hypothetical protein
MAEVAAVTQSLPIQPRDSHEDVPVTFYACVAAMAPWVLTKKKKKNIRSVAIRSTAHD